MPSWCAAGQNYQYLFYLCSKMLFYKMLRLKKMQTVIKPIQIICFSVYDWVLHKFEWDTNNQ